MNRTQPIKVTEIPGPRSRSLAADLRQFESPNVTYLAADFPIFWEKAAGCWITDVDGNTFLDMTAAFGVSAVGHCHPAVVEAIAKQSRALIHGMGDVHPSAVKVRLCERISSHITPTVALPFREGVGVGRNSAPWQVILGQNGSDAVEAALKTARLASGRPGVIAFDGAYHGLSYGALNVTSRDDFRRPFLDQIGDFVRHLPYGCEVDAVDKALTETAAGAVIVEPIQGRGGIVVPPDGWLSALAEAAHRHGALLILDEIFTGWGRTGSLFAHHDESVTPLSLEGGEGWTPDILCVGKAMGGGLPISACVAPPSIMAAWGESRGEALHTSTFLGNPLACAAALAAIDVIETEDLPSRAREMGALLTSRLTDLCARHPAILTGVRGRGLMIGLQTASQPFGDRIMRACLADGLIILPAGDGSVLELVPPLVITAEEIDTAVEILTAVVDRLA